LPAGDPLRAWKENGYSAYWKIYARNKRSLGLNFRAKGASNLLRELAAKADVLVEGFRPGTLEEMGLAPATLHAQNPGLIIVRISGFGQTGPYAPRPGLAPSWKPCRDSPRATGLRTVSRFCHHWPSPI